MNRDEKNFITQLSEASEAQDEAKYSPDVVWAKLRAENVDDPAKAARYPLSFDKVMRMAQARSRPIRELCGGLIWQPNADSERG